MDARAHEGEEARAASIALGGTPRERLRVSTRALTKLLRDPDDTRQVFLLGLTANRRAFPEFLARFAFERDGAELLASQPSIDSAAVDWAALRAMPDGTLGREYVRYLDDNHLDPDLFQAPPGLPEIPSFVAKRLRQTHDIWHVLTGYAPDVPGEVALQGFTYAQTGMPSAALIAVFGALRWMRRHPRLARRTLDGYRRGKKASFLPVVKWEELWSRPVAELRAELGIQPAEA